MFYYSGMEYIIHDQITWSWYTPLRYLKFYRCISIVIVGVANLVKGIDCHLLMSMHRVLKSIRHFIERIGCFLLCCLEAWISYLIASLKVGFFNHRSFRIWECGSSVIRALEYSQYMCITIYKVYTLIS